MPSKELGARRPLTSLEPTFFSGAKLDYPGTTSAADTELG